MNDLMPPYGLLYNPEEVIDLLYRPETDKTVLQDLVYRGEENKRELLPFLLEQQIEKQSQENLFLNLQNKLSKMSKKEQDSLFSKLIKSLSIQGGYEKTDDDFAKGYGYGGRAGLNIPIDDDMLRFGVSGGGFKVDTPFGQFKDSGITGGDVGYKFGPNELGLSYTSRGGAPMARIPMSTFDTQPNDPTYNQSVKNLLQLIYKRQF